MPQQELVDRVTRSFTLLMDAGLFDPVSEQTYTKIPFDTINSKEAIQTNLQAARQSLVLLAPPGPGDAQLEVQQGCMQDACIHGTAHYPVKP